jgi:uncharacterized protein DUF3455
MTTSSKVLLSFSFACLALAAEAAQLPAAVDKNAIIATFHAEGAQIYQCKPDASKPAGQGVALVWQFREPIASLLMDGQSVGRHYAGPSWELVDGGGVKGRTIRSTPAPGANDIPWLEVEVVGHLGKGALSEAVTVLRTNTKGGLAQGPCKTEGEYLSIPYSADYQFLRKI